MEKSYELVSQTRRDKIDFYRFEKDKKLSAGAYLLLKKMLQAEDIANPVFKTEKYGKTYISNCENIYFNLSHSGKMVLCAISDMEVGADIEIIDAEIDLNIAKNFFYNREYESIMNAQDPADEFFRYWVLKESYMKYTGLGMNLELDSFEIVIGDEIKLESCDEDLKFSLFDIEGYKIAAAGHYSVSELIEFDVDEIH